MSGKLKLNKKILSGKEVRNGMKRVATTIEKIVTPLISSPNRYQGTPYARRNGSIDKTSLTGIFSKNPTAAIGSQSGQLKRAFKVNAKNNSIVFGFDEKPVVSFVIKGTRVMLPRNPINYLETQKDMLVEAFRRGYSR